MDDETIKKQWPGFTVSCDACGSKRIELDNSMGFSELSGTWGSIDFVCLDCNQRISLVEA